MSRRVGREPEAITLGHATLMIADVPEFQTFSSWYRERAVMLFCQALDAVALQRELARRLAWCSDWRYADFKLEG